MRKRADRARRKLGLGVEDRSPFDNIYHCCVQRTASQWFRLVLNDEVVYRHTGMYVEPWINRGLDSARIEDPFPFRTIVAHLYIDKPTFDAIPKPESHQAFFVTRDPRDIVVSFYFAAKRSHKPIGEIPELRRRLEGLDDTTGMSLIIDTLDEWGLFRAQRSWGSPGNEHGVRVFRYEDLADDHRAFLSDVFDYLKIPIPESEFEDLCRRKSFKAVTGREQGSEDVDSHLRKGIARDWEDKLPSELVTKIDEVTGRLPAELGY
jgi:hypothetical protein